MIQHLRFGHHYSEFKLLYFAAMQCLGQTGVVKRVGINNRAIVDIGGGKNWCWCKDALRLLAKGGKFCE